MAISEGANTVFPSKVTEYETFPSAFISALIFPFGEVRVQDVFAANAVNGMHIAKMAKHNNVFSVLPIILEFCGQSDSEL